MDRTAHRDGSSHSQGVQAIQENSAVGPSDGREVCVICLERCSEPAVAQPCLHNNFDFSCLVSWLQERASCPLCKKGTSSSLDELEAKLLTGKAHVHSVRDRSRSRGEIRTYITAQKPPCTEVQSTATTSDFAERRRYLRRMSRPRRMPRPSASTAGSALLRRRHVYRNQLYSCHVGSNRWSRFQNLSPEFFRRDEELISRARKWIRRELQVFEFLNATNPPDPENTRGQDLRRAKNAEFLLEYIVAILKTVDIKGSAGQAEEMLQEFLGRDNARLFLHELGAWLRSPYVSLDDWDRAVQYDEGSSSCRVYDQAYNKRHHVPQRRSSTAGASRNV